MCIMISLLDRLDVVELLSGLLQLFGHRQQILDSGELLRVATDEVVDVFESHLVRFSDLHRELAQLFDVVQHDRFQRVQSLVVRFLNRYFSS